MARASRSRAPRLPETRLRSLPARSTTRSAAPPASTTRIVCERDDVALSFVAAVGDEVQRLREVARRVGPEPLDLEAASRILAHGQALYDVGGPRRLGAERLVVPPPLDLRRVARRRQQVPHALVVDLQERHDDLAGPRREEPPQGPRHDAVPGALDVVGRLEHAERVALAGARLAVGDDGAVDAREDRVHDVPGDAVEELGLRRVRAERGVAAVLADRRGPGDLEAHRLLIEDRRRGLPGLARERRPDAHVDRDVAGHFVCALAAFRLGTKL